MLQVVYRGDTLHLGGPGAIATSPIGSVDEFTLAVEIDAAPSGSVFRRIISLTNDPDNGSVYRVVD